MKRLKRAICIAAVSMTVFSLVACSGFSLPAFLIKGDEVESESDWKSAFYFGDVTNATITYTQYESDEDDWVKVDMTYEYDGDRLHVVGTYSYFEGDKDSDDGEKNEPETEKQEMYTFLGEDGAYHTYVYDDENGEWLKQKGNFTSAASAISDLISSYRNSYSSFTYSEYHKGYERGYDPDSEDSSEYSITIVKIKDGLVSVVQRETQDENSKSSFYTWIHAIDGTTVNIPDEIPVRPAEKQEQTEIKLDGKYYMYVDGYKHSEITVEMTAGKLTITQASYASANGTYEREGNKVYWEYTLFGDQYNIELEIVSDGVLKSDSSTYYCKDGKTPPKK